VSCFAGERRGPRLLRFELDLVGKEPYKLALTCWVSVFVLNSCCAASAWNPEGALQACAQVLCVCVLDLCCVAPAWNLEGVLQACAQVLGVCVCACVHVCWISAV